MVYRFDPDILKRRLEGIPSWGQLAFGALLLDRAIPNFLHFAAETGAPGGAMLRGVQAKVWGLLERHAAAPFSGFTTKVCEVFAPDTEEFSSIYTSAALDAVGIACTLLDYADSPRTELLVESAGLRRDSVDMFLQHVLPLDPSDTNFEEQLLSHPLMQEELGFQEGDLAFLDELPSMDKKSWTAVLGRSIELGYGNFRMRI